MRESVCQQNGYHWMDPASHSEHFRVWDTCALCFYTYLFAHRVDSNAQIEALEVWLLQLIEGIHTGL